MGGADGPSVAVALVSLAAIPAVTPSTASAAAGTGFAVTVERGVVYGQGEVGGGGTFADLELDLYKPQGTGQTTFPLIMIIHGGGFINGDKGGASMVRWAQGAAARGYAVASINYRLAGDDPVPSAEFSDAIMRPPGSDPDPRGPAVLAAFEDSRNALDFLVARPDIDAGRVALWGGSAGAITALYVAYGLDDFGIAAPPVHAVVDNWGGFLPQLGDATAIEPGDAPLFVNHGSQDTVVPYSRAEDIVARSQEIGHHYVLHTAVGVGHGFNLHTTSFVPGVSVFEAVLDWLDQVVVEGAGCADPFYDVPAWIADAAEWAYCGPSMTGYADHTFRPNQPITRAEAARLLYLVAGRPDVGGLGDHGFDDVPPWVAPAVDWIADPGNDPRYATGYPDNTYVPHNDITRAETLRMTCRIDGTAAC